MKRTFMTVIMVAAAGIVAPLSFVGCKTSSDSRHDRTAGQYIDDKVLIQRVKAALGDSDVYKFPDVKVQTYRGTVQLTGFVVSQEQKQRAEQITRGINGVYNVQNDIMLKGETERVRGTDATTGTNTTIRGTTTVTTNNTTRTTTPDRTPVTTPTTNP